MAAVIIVARPAPRQVPASKYPECIRADVIAQVRMARLPNWRITFWRLVRWLEVAP